MTAALGTCLLVIVALGSAGGAGCALADGSRSGCRQYAGPLLALAATSAVAAGLLLSTALLRSDFSVAYVAHNGAHGLPAHVRLSSLWAGSEGSLLLWVLMLAVVTVVLFGQLGRRGHPQVPSGVLAAITTFFALLLLIRSNPFAPVADRPADGPGPNPLLQDHLAMTVHPPLLYAGFACTAAPFALSLVALLTRSPGDRWLRIAMPWVRVSWVLLTAAIALGAWWSYSVLGWGGFWAWDPVENIALMPWLAATALLHHVAARRRRGLVRTGADTALAVGGFMLVLLGVSLTRSGAVLSVHAFAESRQGPPLLGMLVACVLVAAVALGRRQQATGEPRAALGVDRASSLVVATGLLVLFGGVVLVGTLYPLVVEGLSGTHAQVGAPYFETLGRPVLLLVLLLMALGPLLRWRSVPLGGLAARLAAPVLVSCLVIVMTAISGTAGGTTALSLGLAGGCLTTVVVGLLVDRPGRRGPARRRQVGVALAHAGFAVVAAGVTVSSAYVHSTEARLTPGDVASLGDWSVRLVSLDQATDATTLTTTARLAGPDGRDSFRPALRYHRARDMVVARPANRTSWTTARQVVLLSADTATGGADVRLQEMPLLGWVWSGAGLMVLGGVLAASGSRRRTHRGAQPGAGLGQPQVVPTAQRAPEVPS